MSDFNRFTKRFTHRFARNMVVTQQDCSSDGYPFFYGDLEEVFEWCAEQFGQVSNFEQRRETRWYRWSWVIGFAHERDAAAFRLRWG